MATYLIAWPNNSWSVLVTERPLTAKELSSDDSPIDMIDCPALATIFQVRMEDGEFLCDLPEHQKAGEPFRVPFTHAGQLRHVYKPSPKMLCDCATGHNPGEHQDADWIRFEAAARAAGHASGLSAANDLGMWSLPVEEAVARMREDEVTDG